MERKFKKGDFVFHQSQDGPQYHYFAEVVKYYNDNKVQIKPILMYSGDEGLDLVMLYGQETVVVPEFSLSFGKEILERKIESTEKRLQRLELLSSVINAVKVVKGV